MLRHTQYAAILQSSLLLSQAQDLTAELLLTRYVFDKLPKASEQGLPENIFFDPNSMQKCLWLRVLRRRWPHNLFDLLHIVSS